MNVNSRDFSNIIESIQMSNDLLKLMAASKLSIDEKMMKADVTANVSGMGENIDTSA